ncbi:hypothetical protein J8N05_46930 (plasmid) [Streptomyces sp. BH-SS-21]|uniref:Uncharacterized protein n=1 Tax=Streptomyces liliiviolaceus TaxID=2823109 RepID=A0A940Y9T8_9ACTN|nr:hypothetical protein [Streptomyces liliiviolaceus]
MTDKKGLPELARDLRALRRSAVSSYPHPTKTIHPTTAPPAGVSTNATSTQHGGSHGAS